MKTQQFSSRWWNIDSPEGALREANREFEKWSNANPTHKICHMATNMIKGKGMVRDSVVWKALINVTYEEGEENV